MKRERVKAMLIDLIETDPDVRLAVLSSLNEEIKDAAAEYTRLLKKKADATRVSAGEGH